MQQLIESQLCTPSEIVEIDENSQFTGLADGTVDFVTELWMSGVVPEEQAFIDDGSVVHVGELGAVGQIGWYVPDYVMTEHPELATWEGLKDPEIAKLFATAETGDKGRFLGTDPSYSAYDEPIINNLGLPFQMQMSGSEAATVAEVDSAVAAKKPILLYWWTPTAAVGKYNLVEVKLPEYTDGCYADVAKVDCAYPADPLVKLASAKLKTKNPAGLGDAREGADHQRAAARLAPAGRDRRQVGRRSRHRMDRRQRERSGSPGFPDPDAGQPALTIPARRAPAIGWRPSLFAS